MFLHSWAVLLGVAAVGLPIAVHLLTRPRPTRMPLSTVRFVREAIRQRRARHRLRDFLVLLLRAAAVLLIALAIARPRFGEQPLVTDNLDGSAVRVVILDVSQSMAANHHGVEGIERARTIAVSHLGYRPGLRANLIIAAARPRAVFTQPSTNFEALRDELAGASVRSERFDVNAGITMAAEMLTPRSEEDDRRRELVVVSDFQRGNWASADLSPLPRDTKIQFESIAPASPLENLAILGAGVRGRGWQGSASALEVVIGNYTNSPRRVTAEIVVGDATYRLKGLCSKMRRTTLSTAFVPRGVGWQTGEARLVRIDDALTADDVRPLAIEVQNEPIYAIITRQTASQRPSSSHYLACALIPDDAAGEQASRRLVWVAPKDVDRETLASADLIVIDHPGKLSREAIELLTALSLRGKPIFYVASELIDATNLRLLADAAGRSLQMPVEFMPPTRGAVRRNLFLAKFEQSAPPFQVFGDAASTIVGRLRFAGGLGSRRLPDAFEDDVLATYNDGTAFLVVSSTGAGALAVINADLGKSNLPTTAEAFVPIVQELAQRLLARGGNQSAIECGEKLETRLSGGHSADDLTIVGPEDVAVRDDNTHDQYGTLSDEAHGVAWRWPRSDQTGVFRVTQDQRPVFAMAVTLPDEESRLDSLPANVLQERLAGGRATHFRSVDQTAGDRDVWWSWLLVGCVMCLLGELVTLTAMRS